MVKTINAVPQISAVYKSIRKQHLWPSITEKKSGGRKTATRNIPNATTVHPSPHHRLAKRVPSRRGCHNPPLQDPVGGAAGPVGARGWLFFHALPSAWRSSISWRRFAAQTEQGRRRGGGIRCASRESRSFYNRPFFLSCQSLGVLRKVCAWCWTLRKGSVRACVCVLS